MLNNYRCLLLPLHRVLQLRLQPSWWSEPLEQEETMIEKAKAIPNTDVAGPRGLFNRRLSVLRLGISLIPQLSVLHSMTGSFLIVDK